MVPCARFDSQCIAVITIITLHTEQLHVRTSILTVGFVNIHVNSAGFGCVDN